MMVSDIEKGGDRVKKDIWTKMDDGENCNTNRSKPESYSTVIENH